MLYKVVTLMAGSATMYDTSGDKPRCVATLERVDIWPDEDPFWIAMSDYVFGMYAMMQDRWSHSFATGRTRRECAAAAAEELGIAPNPSLRTEWWD